jgi:putative ABC transport system ATP-binding protein
MGNEQNARIIRMVGVDKSYRMGEVRVPILEGASLEIRAGRLVVVFGVSGTGKTTLLNLIGALDWPDGGSIQVDGEEISALPETRRTEFRRRKLGFVFQFYNLLPTLTAKENVEASVELLGVTRKEVEARTIENLRRVGLADKAGKFPDQLSGGEQQRVAIARALAKQPRLLLADEPTGNLDEETGLQITELFQEMNRSTGTTMVVVSHNPQIRRIADEVISIEKHKISCRSMRADLI